MTTLSPGPDREHPDGPRFAADEEDVARAGEAWLPLGVELRFFRARPLPGSTAWQPGFLAAPHPRVEPAFGAPGSLVLLHTHRTAVGKTSDEACCGPGVRPLHAARRHRIRRDGHGAPRADAHRRRGEPDCRHQAHAPALSRRAGVRVDVPRRGAARHADPAPERGGNVRRPVDGARALARHGLRARRVARPALPGRPQAGRVPPVRVVCGILAGVLAGLHAAHEARDERGGPARHRAPRRLPAERARRGRRRAPRARLRRGEGGRAGCTPREQGRIKGKLAYMAPEQLSLGDLDRRADVFAAAAVLWEGLTGQRLFGADSPAATVANVIDKEIVAPSTLNPEVSPAVDAIVLRGLSRHPDWRFASAREMAAALEAGMSPGLGPRGRRVGGARGRRRGARSGGARRRGGEPFVARSAIRAGRRRWRRLRAAPREALLSARPMRRVTRSRRRRWGRRSTLRSPTAWRAVAPWGSLRGWRCCSRWRSRRGTFARAGWCPRWPQRRRRLRLRPHRASRSPRRARRPPLRAPRPLPLTRRSRARPLPGNPTAATPSRSARRASAFHGRSASSDGAPALGSRRRRGGGLGEQRRGAGRQARVPGDVRRGAVHAKGRPAHRGTCCGADVRQRLVPCRAAR